MLNTKFNERPLRAGIITPLAYSLNLGDTEGVFSASITVPDEALSVKQLLDRFTSGVELPPIQKLRIMKIAKTLIRMMLRKTLRLILRMLQVLYMSFLILRFLLLLLFLLFRTLFRARSGNLTFPINVF